METMFSFFEIPAKDIGRAVKFYNKAFGLALEVTDCGDEKMSFFPGSSNIPGAISQAAGFEPSREGILLYFNVNDIDEILERIEKSGGRVILAKTRITPEENGCFALFTDCEGNRLGLHSKNI